MRRLVSVWISLSVSTAIWRRTPEFPASCPSFCPSSSPSCLWSLPGSGTSCRQRRDKKEPATHPQHVTGSNRGPKDHINIPDSTFWLKGPRQKGFQKPWFVGFLCLEGLLGPHLRPQTLTVAAFNAFFVSSSCCASRSFRVLSMSVTELRVLTASSQKLPYSSAPGLQLSSYKL